MSLFSEIICSCHSCRSRANNTDFFPCIRQLFSFSFPVQSGVMFRSISFDTADSHRITDFLSFTMQLTYMTAYISQCFRKWNFFPDYCCGSIIISTSDISYVPRNIRMGRACMTAWHNSILFCFICINKLIAYCTCWTYFNACLTKTAIGIF